MRLHDHGAAGREGRRRVATGDGKCQGKIARAKHDHRAEREQHPPQIGAGQRLAIRQRGVDARIDPRALAHELREEPELPAGARALAGDARERQAGFGIRPLEQRVAERLDFGGDRFEQFRAVGARARAILGERLGGGGHGPRHFIARRFVKRRLERRVCRGVDRLVGAAAGFARRAGDETFAVKSHE